MNTMLRTVPKLRGGDKIFLPGLGREDLESIREALTKVGGPISVAIAGGGNLHLGVLEIVVPRVSLSDLRILPVLDYSVNNGEQPVPGVVVSLNTPEHKYLARAQNAFEKITAGVNYDTNKFLKQYSEDLLLAATEFVVEKVKVKLLPGISGQAIGWIAAGENEIHLHPKTIQDLLKCDERLREETVESAEGLVILVSRYPTASPEGIYPYRIRANNRVPMGKIGIHPVPLEERHGGDEDGDILYPLIPTHLVWNKED